MTAHIDRRHLLDALKIVKPAIGSSATNPTLGCVRIVGGTLSATNLDLTITTKLDGSGLDKLDVLVPNAVFGRILAALTGAVVELDVEDRTLNIKSGRAEMAVLCADPFPWPQPQKVNGSTIQLDPAAVSLVSRVLHAAGTDTNRLVLTGVRLHGGRVEATDSYRLARAEIDTGDLDTIIPALALKAVLAQAKDGVTVTAGDNTAEITAGHTTWSVRLIDEEWPNTDAVWPKEFANSVTVSVDDLVAAVSTAASIVGDSDPVRLTLNAGEMTVATQTKDVGESTASLDAEGELPAIAFNPTYLLALLDNVFDDKVTIQSNDEIKPVVATEGAWSSLLMPIRNQK